MKINYNLYKLLLLLTIPFSLSCNKILNKAPLTEFSNETFWTSEQNALMALTGIYRGSIKMAGPSEPNPTDWWSYSGLLFLEFASDNAYDRRGDNSIFNKLSNGTLTPNLSILSVYWKLSYDRIARCNYFLENVSKTPVSPETLKRFIAEARFIRACQYFYLSQYYQDVPLVTKTLSLEEANNVTKASKADVVKFVVDEFTAAAADLPTCNQLTSAERGRATKQAALAFLGRTLLAEKRFSEAAAAYKTIIDLNENIIDPDFESLFDGTNENSKEIIFATQFLADQAQNPLQQHLAPAMVGGWLIYCPLGSLVESYEFTDGTTFSYSDPRYNPDNLQQDRDPRLSYTVLMNNQTFSGLKYISHPDSSKSIDQLTTTKQATRTGFTIRKYIQNGFSGDLSNSGIDMVIIRYAEVLLSYLEAKLEAGDEITQELLDATINKVRGRASVNMPPVTVTDAATLRPILRRERRNELALEGTRYWDLLRWGIAGQVLQGDFYGAPFPGAKNLRKKGGIVDPHSRWYVTSKAFRVGVDEKWPIPQREQDINPNLK